MIHDQFLSAGDTVKVMYGTTVIYINIETDGKFINIDVVERKPDTTITVGINESEVFLREGVS